MAGFVRNILKLSIVALLVPVAVFAVQQKNPRASTNSVRDGSLVQDSRTSSSSVVARSVTKNTRKARSAQSVHSGVPVVVKARSAQPESKVANKSRAGVVKSGTINQSAIPKKSSVNVSRAGTARATAVFNDITKIGGGYAGCRDAYATCMDQFCANANDTYRRCYCSDKFKDFRDTSDRLDKALQLLADFQNQNLNAVDKTAAEVSAMYTATAGENAVKKDSSASQKLLDSITDVLSGKQQSSGLNSLGILDFSNFGLDDDIWEGGSSSIFNTNATSNMADLEGKALYNSAAKQCAEVTRDICGSEAVFKLAQSSYPIMITQDCNTYEKSVNAKKLSVEETIRTAEKYLRDARLEEYRAHNSKDVNECLSAVEQAFRQPSVCGENYERCLDYDTGKYINATTGEPILSKALFELNKLIVFDGQKELLSANPDFNKWMDGRKQHAETALNSCRDIADTVWYEFKRAAIIQIAQAQDEKIQEVKDSCVAVIKECYDNQSGALKETDVTQMQSTNAIAAVTARGMCYDKVLGCASLYGDPDGCAYDDKTQKLSNVSGKTCGLQALLTFVDTVDAAKVAEGCEAALTKYAHELCDEDIGTEDAIKFGKCRPDKMSRSQLRAAMEVRRKTFCPSELVNSDSSNTLQDQDSDAFNVNLMNQVIKNIYDELGIAFTAACEEVGGTWVSAYEWSSPQPSVLAQDFYITYYGTQITNLAQMNDFNLVETGWCIQDQEAQCAALGNYANYNNNMCNMQPAWYEHACEDLLGGYWNNNQCNLIITDVQPLQANTNLLVE